MTSDPLRALKMVVAVMCVLATSCSQPNQSTISETEARASVDAYQQNAIQAIKQLGEIEPIPEESEDTIETCDSDLTGSYLGSDKIVVRSSWNVEQDRSVGFEAVAEALTEDSMEVTPYDPELHALSAEADGFKIIIDFWEPEGTSGRVDLTVKSPCIDGIRDNS